MSYKWTYGHKEDVCMINSLKNLEYFPGEWLYYLHQHYLICSLPESNHTFDLSLVCMSVSFTYSLFLFFSFLYFSVMEMGPRTSYAVSTVHWTSRPHLALFLQTCMISSGNSKCPHLLILNKPENAKNTFFLIVYYLHMVCIRGENLHTPIISNHLMMAWLNLRLFLEL